MRRHGVGHVADEGAELPKALPGLGGAREMLERAVVLGEELGDLTRILVLLDLERLAKRVRERTSPCAPPFPPRRP